MSTIKNAPLIEAIFEISWGEVSNNQLNFSNEEQNLFSGIVSANASNVGYAVTEPIVGVPPVPHQVTHRFRKKKDTWPCIQTGLGIFTINQIGKDYDWDTFKDNIKDSLNIFERSNASNIITTLDNARVNLRYQDAFYPDDKEFIDEYLLKHFHVSPQFPADFFANNDIQENVHNVNMQFEIPLNNNLGIVAITIANAIINTKVGLLVDILVQCKLKNISENGFDISTIMKWLEKAHDVQRHTFNKIIKESAY